MNPCLLAHEMLQGRFCQQDCPLVCRSFLAFHKHNTFLRFRQEVLSSCCPCKCLAGDVCRVDAARRLTVGEPDGVLPKDGDASWHASTLTCRHADQGGVHK